MTYTLPLNFRLPKIYFLHPKVKAAANATGAKFPILTARIASQGKSKHEYEISTENPDLIPVEFLQWPLDSVLPTKNHLSDLHRLVEFEFGIPFSMNPNSVPVSQVRKKDFVSLIKLVGF